MIIISRRRKEGSRRHRFGFGFSGVEVDWWRGCMFNNERRQRIMRKKREPRTGVRNLLDGYQRRDR